MELYKELDFIKVKNKYETSCKKNQEEWQKQINEIKRIKAIKQYKKFEKAIKEI